VCKFGNVNLGPDRCSISVTVDRSAIESTELEEAIVGARLETQITIDPAGKDDVEGQAKMVDTDSDPINSVADCPSLSLKAGKYGFRLSFATGSVNVAEVARMAQQKGKLSLWRVGDKGGET
jgi:hypothetical protein